MNNDGTFNTWQEHWLNNPSSRTVRELKEACEWAAQRIKELESEAEALEDEIVDLMKREEDY